MRVELTAADFLQIALEVRKAERRPAFPDQPCEASGRIPAIGGSARLIVLEKQPLPHKNARRYSRAMNVFGPNTALVSNTIERVRTISWFARIEQPHPQDAEITRVPITWILDKPQRPWRGAFGANENPIERHLFDSGRLEFQVALDRYYTPSFEEPFIEDLLIDLDERFPGYYGETYMYPHELLDLASVERIVRYALYECIVDDLSPRCAFFRPLLNWFADGYWPCGWSAEYPEGNLVVL
ncbi:MAG: hypothetical protein V4710_13735 [Verrucomicrobiota bacterium]